MKRFGLLSLLLLSTTVVAVSADESALRDLYESGRYDAALDRLGDEGIVPGSPTDLFWRYCLTTDPDRAESIYRELAASDDPDAGHLADLLREDLAWIRFAAGTPDSVLTLLDAPGRSAPDAQTAPDRPDAAAFFLRGMSLRAAGRIDDARSAFESALEMDPRDGWSRLQLARLSTLDGDHVTALAQIRELMRTAGPDCRPNALSLWWNLIVGADPKQAKAIEQQLQQDYPGSFAQAAISAAASQRERLLASLRTELITLPEDSVLAGSPPPPVGDYSLALAEFSDRGRALAFVQTWGDSIRGLEINSLAGERGTLRYQVYGGRFPSRSRAALYAEKLDRDYGLEGRIIDLDTVR